MNGFDKRREQKKRQIIHALTDLVMTRNLKDIGVREIAERADVSPASIYNFFGSKEELAKQVIYYHMEESAAVFKELVEDKQLPFREKVNKLFELSMKKQESINSEGMKNLMFEDPDFQKHIEEYSQRTAVPILMQIIEQGKAEGEIAHAISTRAIMVFIGALTAMLSNPAVRDSMDLELRKDFAQLFLYGVFGHRDSKKDKN